MDEEVRKLAEDWGVKNTLTNLYNQGLTEEITKRLVKAFLSGYSAASRWRKYPEEKPTSTGSYPIYCEHDGLMLSFWHNELQGWDYEVTQWFDIPLPTKQGGE